MKFTGERITSEVNDGNSIRHLHRYALTFEYVRNKTVLDIACGEGYGSALMSQYAERVTGIDIDPETISHSKAKYKFDNLDFKEGKAEMIPLANHSVDVVVSFETIEHHDKHLEMMQEIKRVLKPQGLLIISSPDRYVNSEILGVSNPFHVKELTLNEFHDLLKQHYSQTFMLLQKEVHGSLIISMENKERLVEYQGNYDQISKFSLPHLFNYNICFASDFDFPKPDISFFNGNKIFEKALEQKQCEINHLTWEMNEIKNARAFKIYERWIGAFRKLKNLRSKKSNS